MIKVGDALPNVTLQEYSEVEGEGCSIGPNPVKVTDVAAGKTIALFALPGAFTPTEIFQAHRLGATRVKLFPAHRLGPDYLRDLKAPLSSIRLLATGGITPETLPAYSRAGADGFGIGSPLLQPDRLDAEDWDWLRTRAQEFCTAWKTSLFPGK